jgi:UDP:flavonoid glycosyltransferase YjiC (YdhE family)
MRVARRVLFFAEAVTLAHVARPIALARALDPSTYEVLLACDDRYRRFVEHESWRALPLQSIGSGQFLRALAQGSPVYDVDTLRRYVQNDLALIASVKPNLIVGDFRLSLSVSARLAGIPYAAITNAYWSPYHPIKGFPLPALPMTRFLPLPAAEWLFRAAQPVAFGLHCKPLNRVRQENGLPSLGGDLRRVYTDADHTLYADVPAMFPTEQLPTSHHYIGPVLWSPPVPPPGWWADLPADKSIVYLTLGSSGASHLMPMLLDALASLPIAVMAATAGAPVPAQLPANAFVADYLPGMQAAARANLVVCNGGSPTSQQALAAGVPVLGIAGNMDQFLNMASIVKAGAGAVLRADRLSRAALQAAVRELLAGPGHSQGARALASEFAKFGAPRRFADLVCRIMDEPTVQATTC